MCVIDMFRYIIFCSREINGVPAYELKDCLQESNNLLNTNGKHKV